MMKQKIKELVKNAKTTLFKMISSSTIFKETQNMKIMYLKDI